MSYTIYDELLDVFDELDVTCDGDMNNMLERVVRVTARRHAKMFSEWIWYAHEEWVREHVSDDLAPLNLYGAAVAVGLRKAAKVVEGDE